MGVIGNVPRAGAGCSLVVLEDAPRSTRSVPRAGAGCSSKHSEDASVPCAYRTRWSGMRPALRPPPHFAPVVSPSRDVVRRREWRFQVVESTAPFAPACERGAKTLHEAAFCGFSCCSRTEEDTAMLIDSLTFTLEKSGCLDAFWGKLDAGEDGTLGVASSARPFLVAARFAHKPQTTLAVVAGEDAAVAFARQVAAYLGDERVMRFPERTDYPFNPKPSDPAQVARRMEAVHALASGREVVVVASARSLVRTLPPAGSNVHLPLVFEAGRELADMGGAEAAGVAAFEDVARAFEERGYLNTGELDGPGTFAPCAAARSTCPGNLVYPVRLDFFGDELDEIRRIVPTTGQTIQALRRVDVYPVVEFAATKSALARARQKLERPAQSNAALRDVLEKLGRRPALRRIGRCCRTCNKNRHARGLRAPRRALHRARGAALAVRRHGARPR